MTADIQLHLTGVNGIFLHSRYEKRGVRYREYEEQPDGTLADIGSALLTQYSPSWTPAGEGLALELRDFAGQGSTRLAEGRPVFGGAFASSTLSASAQVHDGDTVTIGELSNPARVYTFRTAPAVANDVQIGPTKEDSLANLAAAINLTGDAGPQWFAGTERHRDVHAIHSGATIRVWSKDCGMVANMITTTESSGSRLSWSSGQLTGGTGHQGVDLVWQAVDLTDIDIPAGSRSRRAVWSLVGKLAGGEPVMLFRGTATIYAQATVQ